MVVDYNKFFESLPAKTIIALTQMFPILRCLYTSIEDVESTVDRENRREENRKIYKIFLDYGEADNMDISKLSLEHSWIALKTLDTNGLFDWELPDGIQEGTDAADDYMDAQDA